MARWRQVQTNKCMSNEALKMGNREREREKEDALHIQKTDAIMKVKQYILCFVFENWFLQAISWVVWAWALKGKKLVKQPWVRDEEEEEDDDDEEEKM